MMMWIPKGSAAPEVFTTIRLPKAAFCRLHCLVCCKALLELSDPDKVPVLSKPFQATLPRHSWGSRAWCLRALLKLAVIDV